MNPKIKITLQVLTLILLMACNTSDNKGTHPTTDTVGVQQVVKEPNIIPVAGVRLKDDKLNAVYPHYTHLTKALIGGDLAAAKIAATAIEVGAQAIAGGKDLAVAAAKISAAADLERQRAAFAALSKSLIALIKKSGLESGTLFIEHCPMALKDKGADWLSESKEIKNPYFGNEMMSCGEVVETLH